MLASIIGYVLTVLFVWFSMIMFREMFKRARHDNLGTFVALCYFVIFGLLSLGTAYIAGL